VKQKPSPAEKAIAQMRKKLRRRRKCYHTMDGKAADPAGCMICEPWISSDAYHAADKPQKPSTGTTIAVKCGRESPQEAPESKVSPDSTSDLAKD